MEPMHDDLHNTVPKPTIVPQPSNNSPSQVKTEPDTAAISEQTITPTTTAECINPTQNNTILEDDRQVAQNTKTEGFNKEPSPIKEEHPEINIQPKNTTNIPDQKSAENTKSELVVPKTTENATNEPVIPKTAENSTNEPVIPKTAENATNEPVIPKTAENSTNNPIIPKSNETTANEPALPKLNENVANEQPIPNADKANSSQSPNEENKSVSFDEIPIGQKSKQIFEEFPVGKKSSQMIPEFPPEEKAIEEEKGTLDERLVSKAWASRAKAFEELAKQIPAMDAPSLEVYSKKWSKYINDSNAASQEKAIDALKVFIEKYDPIDEALAEAVAISLIEKGMTSMKTNTKTKSTDCLLFLIENSSQFVTISKVIVESLAKAPKIQLVAAQFSIVYIANFGIAQIDMKPFLKGFEKLATSTNAGLRTEAMNFYKEIYRWIRDAILPLIANLKQAQQDELKKMFEEIKESPTPLRLTKKEKSEGKTAEAFKGPKGKQPAKIDPFDLQDAQDSLSKFNESWCEKFSKLATWKEKKEALDDVLKAASVPKIKCPPQQCFLITAEKIIDKESNIVVISLTIKVLTAMAVGLRKQFTGWKGLVPRLLSKCKEKKLEHDIMKCIEEMRWAINLNELLDDIKELTISEKSKQVNPATKRSLSDWLGGYLKESSAIDFETAKSIAKMILALSDDSSNEVRDSSLNTLGILKAKSNIDSILNDLNSQKKEKIERSYNACIGKEGSPPAEKGKHPKQEAPKKKEEERSPKKKEDAKAPKEHKKEEKKKSSKKAEAKEEANDDDEEAGDSDKIITEKINASIITLLNSSAWKEKKEGFTQLTECVNNDKETYIALQEPLVKYIKKLLKGWKESNLNILKETFAFFAAYLNCGVFTKKASFHLLGLYIEKISESKYSAMCDEGILKITESTGPTFVCNRILKLSESLKAAPALKGVCNVMNHLLKEFPVKLFPVKAIIEFAKGGLSGNPTVKVSSTDLIKTTYSFLGEAMKSFIADLKEPQLKPLEAELAKVEIVKAPNVSKHKLIGEASEEEAKTTGNALDALIPRVDISSQVTAKLIKSMSDSQWKARNSSLNEIKSILTKANNRIMPNGLNELFKDIGLRIKDSHKGVQRGFIQLVSAISEAIGQKVRIYSKFILPNLIDTLSDKQQLLRQDSLLSITKFAEIAGMDIVVNQMAPMLMKDSPEMRSEILKWILRDKECLKNCDQKTLIPPIIAAMQDKSKEIRVMAEQMVPYLMPYVGVSSFITGMQDLKQAVKNTLKPIIEKYDTNTDHSATPLIEIKTEEVKSTTTVSTAKQDTSPESKSRTRNDNKTTLHSNTTKPQDAADSRPKTSMTIAKSKASAKQEAASKAIPKNAPKTKAGISTQKLMTSPSHPTLADTMGKVVSASTTEINKMMPFVLVSNKDKDKRSEFDRKHPWPSDEIREDYVEWIKKWLKPILNPNVFNAMFTASNFKKHTDCVVALKIALKSEINEIIEILDLLLKWICCRLIDNNPGLNKAIIELLNELIISLEAVSYTLYDSEAAILLPLMTERTGNQNAFLKEACKEVIKKIVKIFAPQKVINYLVKALKCKNLKARVECVDLIRYFITSEQSMESMTDKNLNFLAISLATKDNVLKNAIYQIFTEAFKMLGSDCWKHIGKIDSNIAKEIKEKVPNSELPEEPSAHKSGIKVTETIIRELTVSNEKPVSEENKMPPKVQNESIVVEQKQIQPEAKEIVTSPPINNEIDGKQPITANKEIKSAEPTQAPSIKEIETPNAPLLESNEKEEQLQISTSESSGMGSGESVLHPELSFEKLLEKIETGNSSTTLEDLLVLNEIMYIKYEKNEQSIIANANRMVNVFIGYFQKMVISESTVTENRLSYLINTIHRFTTIKPVTLVLNIESLTSLIELLLSKLIIEGLNEMGTKKEGHQIANNLNASVLRLLDNANNTLTLIALIRLIEKYKITETQNNMYNLILKCILKLKKGLNYIITNVDVGKILSEISLFLSRHPSISEEDTDYKTLKALVAEIVLLKKEKIWEDYAVIKSHDFAIRKWIEKMLKDIASTVAATPVFDNELKEILKSFKEFGFKTSIGKMYDYMRKNPTFDLSKGFPNCSSAFISHLKGELEEERIKREKDAETAKPKTSTKPVIGKQANITQTLGLLREKLSGPKKMSETISTNLRTKIDKYDMKDSQERLKELSEQIKKLKMGEWNNN